MGFVRPVDDRVRCGKRTEEWYMKAGLHPAYQTATITCACGAVLTTRSTLQDIRIEICSACHPFFTGTQKIIDTEGRVERFRKKYAKKPAARRK